MEREPEKRNTQRKEVAHTQTAQQAAGPQPGQEQERSHGLETQEQGGSGEEEGPIQSSGRWSFRGQGFSDTCTTKEWVVCGKRKYK